MDNSDYALDEASNANRLFLTILKVLAVAGIALVLGLIAWRFMANLNFRMNGTSPQLNKAATLMPFIDVQFNRELAKGVTATSKDEILTGSEIKGKVLRVNLYGPDRPLEEGKKYTITIKNIANTNGERLPDKNLTFTAQVLTAEEMPKAQREFLLKRQANKPLSPDNIILDNISDLQNQGLEPAQEESFRAALYVFKEKAKITRITSNVEAIDPVKAQELGMQVYNFDMQIDDKKYKVRLECPDVSAVRVLLSDQQGKQVYDSGIIDQEGGD